MTNFNRIKNMTTDELAMYLTDFNCFELCEHEGSCKTNTDCINGLKKYLEMEVADEK